MTKLGPVVICTSLTALGMMKKRMMVMYVLRYGAKLWQNVANVAKKSIEMPALLVYHMPRQLEFPICASNTPDQLQERPFKELIIKPSHRAYSALTN